MFLNLLSCYCLGDYDFSKDNGDSTNNTQSNTINNGSANNGNTNNGNSKPPKNQRSKGQQNKSPAKNKSSNATPAANGQQVIVNGSSTAPDVDSA